MIEKIMVLLDKFIDKNIELDDLQKNILCIINSGVCENLLYEILYDFENKLEEIRFCNLKKNYYSYTIHEINKLKSNLRNM